MASTESTLIHQLAKLTYFESLTEDALDALATITQKVTLPEGDLVFGQGESASRFYIVLSGQVQIYKLSAEGKEMILHLLEENDLVAAVPVFSDTSIYPANCLCMAPTTLLSIDGKAFKGLVSQYPEIALTLLTVFAKRLHHFSDVIEDLSLRTVDSRLAKYLLSVSEQSPDKAVIQIHKKTLSSILGTVPETLSRGFKKLSDKGLIRVDDNKVHLINREQLSSLAGLHTSLT